ncbi:MAG: HNH endonuclease [Verrucomicrobia bacterium]|nr:HNH endonuclease [Verrucomicrobiota bacterium]
MASAAELRRQIIERAGNRCEYCGLAQAGQEAAFHVDHVVPVSAGGLTNLDNLALACVSCSLRKGARQVAPDPQTGEAVALFNPRRDAWRVHFRWDGVPVVGLTPTGRATVEALRMNRALAWAIRAEEAHRGRHPPLGHT